MNITIKCDTFYNVHKYSVATGIHAVPKDSWTGENLGMGRFPKDFHGGNPFAPFDIYQDFAVWHR